MRITFDLTLSFSINLTHRHMHTQETWSIQGWHLISILFICHYYTALQKSIALIGAVGHREWVGSTWRGLSRPPRPPCSSSLPAEAGWPRWSSRPSGRAWSRWRRSRGDAGHRPTASATRWIKCHHAGKAGCGSSGGRVKEKWLQKTRVNFLLLFTAGGSEKKKQVSLAFRYQSFI